MLLDDVQRTIGLHHLFDRGETVLVAVSGGVDSVVLLDILSRLGPALDLKLVVGHLDHGLRPESEADAAWVMQLARAAGIEIIAERLPSGALPAEYGAGLEAGARTARHAFLARAAQQAQATKIALGHTASDRAETLLFRLARGTGIDGLAVMPAAAYPVVRPLILATRSEILGYAHARQLTWRDDESNSDVSFARNRIRHRVLPELEKINPHAVAALCRAADLAHDAQTVAAALVAQLWADLEVEPESKGVALDRARLRALPESIRALVLREACRRARGGLTGFERGHIDDLSSFIAGEAASGGLDLPGLRVSVVGGCAVFGAQPPADEPLDMPVHLGRNRIANHGLVLDLRIVESGSAPSAPRVGDRLVERADADRVSFPLTVRTRRPGDRFIPLGMETPVKLKDFLINEKIPRDERSHTLLLCDQQGIVWIIGHRLSDRVRVGRETRRVLEMHWEAV